MSIIIKVFIVIIVLVLLAGGGYFIYKTYFVKKPTAESQPSTSNLPLTIPQDILENKFGFLGGGPESSGIIQSTGAAWIRPHPGLFLWDSMQKDANSEVSFTHTDREVKEIQENQLGALVTLWPFADWDQKMRTDAEQCRVSDNDEFLPKNDIKDRGDYLPQYRCNPKNWDKYQTWVKTVVERYDGDGISDMPGLKIPIKYWEVMNEPDLTSPAGEDRLDFYKEDGAAYAEILIKTSMVIRQADPNAQILIAGAAGGNPTFLNFYRGIFKNKDTYTAFDIANVHCISNDTGNDFNVSSYKNMLQEFGIDKPIWVTEAENMTGKTLSENAELTKTSTQGAISAGAKKIFYTRYNFNDFRKNMSEKSPEESKKEEEPKGSVQESLEIYKDIFENY